MNKKLICVVMTLVLLCMSSVAFAAGVPSKTTEDMAAVVEVTTSTGATVAPEFVVTMDVTSEEEVAVAIEELTAIATFVAEQNVAPIQYFADEVKTQVAELLPETVDLDKLAMNEFAPLAAIAYDETYGDVEVTMSFATKYSPDQALVALVGVGTDEAVVWYPLAAEANEDGTVKVQFTEEVLKLIEANPAMVAILSEDEVEAE